MCHFAGTEEETGMGMGTGTGRGRGRGRGCVSNDERVDVDAVPYHVIIRYIVRVCT